MDSVADYEVVPCICGQPASDVVLAEVDRHGLPCRNVLCLDCGLVRLSPRWTEPRYQRFYELEYRNLYDVRNSIPKAEFAQAAAHGAKARDIGKWCEATYRRLGASGNGKVVSLEIGAGAGWNSANLPKNWLRMGFDVDRAYLEIGRDLFGLDMRFGLFDEAMSAVKDANLVLLSHVVEHFLDPVGTLRKLASNMQPGALLLIEVPGLLNIHRQHLHLMTYLQNAHTFLFCAETLKATCEEAGYRVIEIDQSARAVCVAGSVTSYQTTRGVGIRNLRYLQACELGWFTMKKLRNVPLVGRYSAALWRRAFYPAVGWRLAQGI